MLIQNLEHETLEIPMLVLAALAWLGHVATDGPRSGLEKR
jgi:hypothetical protein